MNALRQIDSGASLWARGGLGPRLGRGLVRLALAASIGLLSTGLLGGCFRYQTHIPGVLDLRSDAGEAERTRPRPPDEEEVEDRTDIERFLLGRGVVRQGKGVLIEERHYWVSGFVPLINTSATEEIEATVAANGALTDVAIGESYSGTDIMMATIGSLLFPPVGFMLPPYTFTAEGTPVRLPPRPPPAEAPPAEAPPAEAPPAEAPPAEAPPADAPATDAPATDAPATDAPATDALPPEPAAGSPPDPIDDEDAAPDPVAEEDK